MSHTSNLTHNRLPLLLSFTDWLCNRSLETRQKLCGAVLWYRAAVVERRRPIPETRVRSRVATHLLTSLNLPVSSLAPDSSWIPATLVADDGLEARAGCRALGRHDSVKGTLKQVKSSVARSGGICDYGGLAQETNS